MAYVQALHALRRRYAETLGGQHPADDLEPLAAVIRMFSPSEDLNAIEAIRPYVNRRGRWGPVWARATIEVLRTANAPMSAAEIARRVLADRGMDGDQAAFKNVQSSILTTLRTKPGVFRSGGGPVRWSLRGPA